MYKMNPCAYGSVFVLPSDVVDKHLRLAGSAQLKVLLWLCRNTVGGDIGELAKLIGISKADAVDALQYWIDCGLIIDDENPAPPAPPPSAFAPSDTQSENGYKAENQERSENIPEKNSGVENGNTQKRTELPELPVIKPTMQQLAARAAESDAIRELFLEAQKILGRTIGYDAQSSLLMLHDHYGLPAEVILMICEYARSHNKQSSMNYITKMGKNWAESEIDTFDKAVEQINRLEESNKAWQKLKTLAGISTPQPTSTQQKYLAVWVGEWNFSVDMIYAAYEEMAERTGKLSFGYMNKILSEWHNQGFKNPDDIDAQKETRRKELNDIKNAPKSKKPNGDTSKNPKRKSNASYDLDEAERRAQYEPIVYKKKSQQ